MANPTINWLTRVITVPQSFLVPLGGTNYQLDTNKFRLALRDIEDDEAGAVHPPTHNHNTSVLLGGIEYARVIEMINGYSITFEDTGSPYAVSLAGSNNNILDVANLNNVAIRSNNSAGLMSMREIEYGAFDSCVTIDQMNGSAGTLYPKGTSRDPVNNLADAVSIANSRGFGTIHVRGSLLLDTGDNIEYFKLVGDNAMRSMILINPGAATAGVEIINAAVTGTLDGSAIIRESYVFDLAYVTGFLFNCQLGGTITLGGAVPASILQCFSSTDGVTIDMGGTGHALNASSWSGSLRVSNKAGADACVIHMQTGDVILDATVTNGAGIHVGGVGNFTNESAVTPEHQGMLDRQELLAGMGGGSGPILYAPTSITRDVGDDEGGTLTSILTLDESEHVTGEVVGVGLDVRVAVSATDAAEHPSLARITGHYQGGAGHQVGIYAYNYLTADWDRLGAMSSRTTPFAYTIPLTGAHQNQATGEMVVRFWHDAATYIAAHQLRIDHVEFQKVQSADAIASDVAAIKAQTDQLQFLLGHVQADVRRVNTKLLTGSGVQGDPWRPV
jgi:hypothetical protein